MDDRIEAMSLNPSCVTLKDHKEDWPARIHCRLIIPTKTNLGRISKTILERGDTLVQQTARKEQIEMVEV